MVIQHCSIKRVFQQRYSQVNDNFLKSEHPAVARTKPGLSSPFPMANPAFGSPAPLSSPADPYSQDRSPGDLRPEAETQEVIPSYNDYIIPIPDPKPEEDFTDVESESPARYEAAEKTLLQMCAQCCTYKHTPTYPDV